MVPIQYSTSPSHSSNFVASDTLDSQGLCGHFYWEVIVFIITSLIDTPEIPFTIVHFLLMQVHLIEFLL